MIENNSNIVYKIAKRGLLLLGLLFCVDIIFGYFFQKLYLSETQGDSSNTTHIINNANEDLVIFGSSRAVHHYNCTILKDSLHLTTYNAGRDGMTLQYQLILLKALLKHHIPKKIVLDLNPIDLIWKIDNGIITAAFLPYISNPIIANEIVEIDKSEFWKAKIFNLYKYNSLPASVCMHQLHIGEKSINGYKPVFAITDTASIKLDTKEKNGEKELIPALENALDGFIKLAKQNNITLYLIISPTLKVKDLETMAFKKLKEVVYKNNIEISDYSNLFGKNKLMFHDITHLNASGADIFTKKIANLLK